MAHHFVSVRKVSTRSQVGQWRGHHRLGVNDHCPSVFLIVRDDEVEEGHERCEPPPWIRAHVLRGRQFRHAYITFHPNERGWPSLFQHRCETRLAWRIRSQLIVHLGEYCDTLPRNQQKLHEDYTERNFSSKPQNCRCPAACSLALGMTGLPEGPSGTSIYYLG